LLKKPVAPPAVWRISANVPPAQMPRWWKATRGPCTKCGNRAASFASRLASRSVDQFARTLGVTNDEAEDIAQQSSRSLGAIVQSTALLSNGMRAVWTESFELMRRQFERSLDHMDELARCRTPQELAAVQSDAVRRQLEAMIQSTHRIAEISLQTAGEASRQVSETVERVARAA
jgi:hypothetical protein